jgi:hypothetical protein
LRDDALASEILHDAETRAVAAGKRVNECHNMPLLTQLNPKILQQTRSRKVVGRALGL